MTELLKQVRILDPSTHTDQIGDVLIEDGAIVAIAPSLTDYSDNTHIYDQPGLILGTGLVDLYSHSGEPGFEERETLATLTQAALTGGFTRLGILPNTLPPIDNPAGVSFLQQQLATLSTPLKINLWGALTQNVKGQNMTELAELAQTDIVGFSDGKPITHLSLLRRLLEYLQPLNKPVALWANSPELAGNGLMREGIFSLQFGLSGNPAISETVAVATLLEMIAEIGTPVHLMRISTARSVELIAQAKANKLPITASTTWIHLLLDCRALSGKVGIDCMPYHPSLRLEPPLGNPEDHQALIQAVKDGTIDAIAIDHTPYTYEEKTVAFGEAPPGTIGLELALPLLWNTFVKTHQLSALELWRALSTNPALCLQQPPAHILPQSHEFTLFDPNQTWSVDAPQLKSLALNTPWLGQEITGKIVKTWC